MTAALDEKSGGGRVCPHQMAFMLDNWIRRLIQNPVSVTGDYIDTGHTVVDIGCGPGFFTIDMARMVGPTGRVIAVDLQTNMLRHVERKAIRHGVADRVVCHPCAADGLGLTCVADFILAFYVVHETPDTRRFFEETLSLLAPGGKLLVVEPKMHVKQAVFESMVATAVDTGLKVVEFPSGKGGHAVLLAPAD